MRIILSEQSMGHHLCTGTAQHQTLHRVTSPIALVGLGHSIFTSHQDDLSQTCQVKLKPATMYMCLIRSLHSFLVLKLTPRMYIPCKW